MAHQLNVLAILLSLILGAMGDVAPNATLNTESLIRRHGYPVETHTVTTNDGYVLTMHRIPFSARVTSLKPRPVVFVQHGLLCSSSDWVVAGVEKGLAFVLSDAGYDVWLGNARGNTYSRKHITLDPSSKKFWDFDWHEIGVIDLPAMIFYAMEKTGVKKISYIGHSQGTTAFLVLNSLFPDFGRNIESAHLLSPVAYMSHLTSSFVKYSAPLMGHPTMVMPVDIMGNYEFQPSKKLMSAVGGMICRNRVNKVLCSNPLFLCAGFDEDTISPDLIDDVMATGPAGASTKQFLHYMQEYNSGKFRCFDYGMARNMMKYRQISPPDYILGQIDVRLYLYFSDNDSLAAVEDVEQLIRELNCFVEPYRIPIPNFDHLGQMYHPNITDIVYDRLIGNIQFSAAKLNNLL